MPWNMREIISKRLKVEKNVLGSCKLRLQSNIFTVVLNGEVKLVGAISGESVLKSVIGFESSFGLVNRNSVEFKKRGLTRFC